MSEYQVYQFQAVDRPLTKAQMAEVRRFTTRATITPTYFHNVYHWGSFKGDPLALMKQYYDAFLYTANWGTRQLMLRLPRRLLDPETVEPYVLDQYLEFHLAGDFIILNFYTDQEDDEDYGVDDDEDEGWLAGLLPLRTELAAGDLRPLYIAWLAGAGWPMGYEEDPIDPEGEDYRDVEPPVPAGLKSLSAAQTTLAEFLRVDEDLLAAAAETSPEPWAIAAEEELELRVRDLPAAEKDDLLIRAVRGEGAMVRGELLARFRQEDTSPPTSHGPRRAIRELLTRARQQQDKRDQREAEQAALEKARREQEEAATRARYLDGLAAREGDAWREAESFIETKRPGEYDLAVKLLSDLRELAVRDDELALFAVRLGVLRDRYSRRTALMARLDQAGLQA